MTKLIFIFLLSISNFVLADSENIKEPEFQELNINEKIESCSYGIILPFYLETEKKNKDIINNTILKEINKEKYLLFKQENQQLSKASESFCRCIIKNTNIKPDKDLSAETLTQIINIHGQKCISESNLNTVLSNRTTRKDIK